MMNSRQWTKGLAVASAILATLIFLVIIISWTVAALSPDADVHSLLGSEGVRWLFGSFTENVSGPLIAWTVLIAMAYGTTEKSGIVADLIQAQNIKQLTYRQKFAFRIVIILAAFFIIAVIALTLLPHAVLLSVTGQLFPSSFSRSLIPMTVLVVIILSAVYGKLCGKFNGIYDIFKALCSGIAKAAPLFLPIILAEELWHVVFYVF